MLAAITVLSLPEEVLSKIKEGGRRKVLIWEPGSLELTNKRPPLARGLGSDCLASTPPPGPVPKNVATKGL